MSTLENPANRQHELSVLAQGVLATDTFTFDLAAAYAAGLDEADAIVIGHVPVDCVLVPWLCKFSVPVLDEQAETPPGEFQIGTEAEPDALLAATGADAPVVKYGHQLKQAEGIGSTTERTPILLTVSTGLGEATASGGVITAELVFRATNPFVD
jgi:hypothetical protein